jgi:hypothetical protein
VNLISRHARKILSLLYLYTKYCGNKHLALGHIVAPRLSAYAMIGRSGSGRQGQMSHDLDFVLWKISVNAFTGEGGFRDDNFVVGDCNCLGATGSVRPNEASAARAARAVRTVRLCAYAIRCDGAECCVLHIRWGRARGEARRALLHGLSEPEHAASAAGWIRAGDPMAR